MHRFILFLYFLSYVYAQPYWVDDNGTANWTNARSFSPLSGTSCTTYDVANRNASAGDTIYYRAGTYSIRGSGIAPSNSGSSGNRIVFEAYNGENVVFTDGSGSSMAVNLQSGQDYITVRGITCLNFYHHLHIEGSSGNYTSYNEIDGCTFSDMYNETNIDWRGSTIEDYATYNWIHNCTFEKYGYFGNNDDEGVPLEIGWDSGITEANYNLIEDCIIQSGGHHVVGLQGYRNILRNNYLQNDGWQNIGGTNYGCKVLYTVCQIPNGFHLIEGNRISFGDQSSESQSEGEGLLHSARGCIIRNNVFDHNNENAIYIHKHGAGGERADENYFYNNTFWYNGHDLYDRGSSYYSHAIVIWTGDASGNRTEYTDNVFKNNIFYDNANELNRDASIISDISSQRFYPDHCEYANNWEDGRDGNPNFVDTYGTPNPNNKDQYDLNLGSNSPCIDRGAFLTTITSASGTGSSFSVDDAAYFFDGWGIAEHIPSANIKGDIIQLEGQSSTATITIVNYVTNTITVDKPLTWTKGQGISLAYLGDAPDIGAYESSYTNPTTGLLPPHNPRISK